MKRAGMAAVCLLLCMAVCRAAWAAPFDDDGVLRLVNRDEKITKNYVPADMILPDVPTNKKSQRESIYMRPEAAHALEDMFRAAAEEQGYTLLAVSGYRSYFEQQAMFKNKVESVGGDKERAWRTVAPAGASEHQLGLAMDVLCDNYRYLNSGFLDTAEGKWLYENCHRFGFIVRYRKEWSDITGYAAEPWHFRYLGVSHACAVQWLNVPYETYAHAAMALPEYVLTEGNAYLLYGLMNDLINGNGEYLEELMDSSAETEEQRRAVMEEMTAYFLPEGVTLEMALRNEVH